MNDILIICSTIRNYGELIAYCQSNDIFIGSTCRYNFKEWRDYAYLIIGGVLYRVRVLDAIRKCEHAYMIDFTFSLDGEIQYSGKTRYTI